jgi:hypothetical protein
LFDPFPRESSRPCHRPKCLYRARKRPVNSRTVSAPSFILKHFSVRTANLWIHPHRAGPCLHGSRIPPLHRCRPQQAANLSMRGIRRINGRFILRRIGQILPQDHPSDPSPSMQRDFCHEFLLPRPKKSFLFLLNQNGKRVRDFYRTVTSTAPVLPLR